MTRLSTPLLLATTLASFVSIALMLSPPIQRASAEEVANSAAPMPVDGNDTEKVTDVRKAAEVFADADLDEGMSLIEQHACEACHARNVGGNGAAIYRPNGRINTPGFLRGMVEYCNTQLNLQLFPEEVTSIGAVLNKQHYRFE